MYSGVAANHEMHCTVLTTTPYCGTRLSGGPLTGAGYYYDLGDNTDVPSSSAHRGWVKAVDATTENFSVDNSFTFSMWTKREGFSSIGSYLVSKTMDYATTGTPDFGNDDQVCMDVGSSVVEDGGATGCGFLAATDMGAWKSNGDWQHLVFRFDGDADGTDDGYMDVWIDGTKTYTVGTTGTIGDSAGFMTIGPVNTWSYNGGLDEVVVWDTAITDAEIALMGACVVPD
jgi:hypothetical protein